MNGFIQQVEFAFDKAKTDKGYEHQYQGLYGLLMTDPPNSILEIGIKNGRSIMAWQLLFPHADITGIDIEKQSLGSGVKPFKAIYHDATTYDYTENYDWIIDDGSHIIEDIIAAFDRLKDRFNKIYVIEDVRLDPNKPDLDILIDHIEKAGFHTWLLYKSRFIRYQQKGIEGFAVAIINPNF